MHCIALHALSVTLFKDRRASTGRRFRYSVAMNAPNILIRRTCKIGMDATSKSDQKPISVIKLNLQLGFQFLV